MQVGTTSSSAVDPLHAIGDLAKSFGMWFHIDAAYAGSACICPEFRPFLDGVEKADSFCLNPHKWLLINFDSSCLWVKDPKALESALSTDPEYLKNKVSSIVHSSGSRVQRFLSEITCSIRFEHHSSYRIEI